MTVGKFQIGKNGITSGVLDSLRLVFKNNKHVRISVLRASGRDRNSIKLMAQEIADKLPAEKKERYTFSIIGFTIAMRKHVN